MENLHATLATSVSPALIWVIPGRPETTTGSRFRRQVTSVSPTVSVQVAVCAWSVVSTVYDARFDLQAARLPMRLTRAAIDRPRRAWSSFRASAIP